MIRDKRKKRVLGLIISAFVIVGITTVTYAFYDLVVEDTNSKKVALTTGIMKLVFADNDNEIIGGEWDFGESVTKKFTLTNTGTVAASASLDWKNLVNTYQNRSLSYRLLVSTTEDGPTREIVSETNMPVTASPIRQTLCSEISVPVGTTYYYQLVITLNDLPDVEQSADIGAEFNTEFIVDQPKQYRYYRLTINTNGGVFIDNTITEEHLLKHQNTVELEEPTRTGYTFAGWRILGTGSTVEDTTFTMGISDTYLYAEWTPEEYILSINRNDGSSIENRTVKYNTPTVIENPTREGYTFTGWNVTGGTFNGNEFTLTTVGNASIEATWVQNYKYIVYHNQMNLDGKTYTLVSADTDENEAMLGSTITPNTKTYTGFTSPEKKSLTIQAETTYPPLLNKIDYNYSRNKYNLIIDPNGGTYNGKTENTIKGMYYGASKDFSPTTIASTTLAALGKTVKEGTPDFSTLATTDETADGLYSMEDDYGTSYYYRGAVTDNYVYFAGFYWRIIRVNGDGSLRMIYDGTAAYENGVAEMDRFISPEEFFNDVSDDVKYARWMFGGNNGEASTSKDQAQTNETNSTLKDMLNTWYDENLSGYDTYIADAVYCSDSRISSEEGFGMNMTSFDTQARLIDSNSPTFVCTEKNDAFTVSDSVYGNAIGEEKSRKIGLITADEILAAGSSSTVGEEVIDNTNHYLYRGFDYWSMTPYGFDGEYAEVFMVGGSGELYGDDVDYTYGVAPVITLTSEYAKKLVGTGTYDDPFSIVEIPQKTGYTFTGWTKTSGKGTLEGSTYTMGDGDATITANYEPKSYSVTFNANGGTVDIASKTVAYDGTYGDLPEPTYSGYKFLGWFTSRTYKTQVTKNTKVTITESQELFALWQWNFSVPQAVTAILNNQIPEGVKPGNPSFGIAATTDEGVYSMEDDYGTSYYYRGAVTNNYVKFAHFYWRIIRINGDGSLRMIYDGTKAYKNGENGTGRLARINITWMQTDRDAKYVGWMYGGTLGSASTAKGPNYTDTTKVYAQNNEENSNIKTVVNEWYDANLTGFDEYIADAVYCNDRSIETGDGFGTSETYYGAYGRFVTNRSTSTPQFRCPNKNDAFTVSDSEHGNAIGKEKSRKIGLITADEIIAAGSDNNTFNGIINNEYYLYKGANYWSLSPYYFDGRYSHVFGVNERGNMLIFDVFSTYDHGVAPVISLKAEYAAQLTGDGTATNPYVLAS